MAESTQVFGVFFSFLKLLLLTQKPREIIILVEAISYRLLKKQNQFQVKYTVIYSENQYFTKACGKFFDLACCCRIQGSSITSSKNVIHSQPNLLLGILWHLFMLLAHKNRNCKEKFQFLKNILNLTKTSRRVSDYEIQRSNDG